MNPDDAEFIIHIGIGTAGSILGALFGGALTHHTVHRHRDRQAFRNKQRLIGELKTALKECEETGVAQLNTLEDALDKLPEKSPLRVFIQQLILRPGRVTPAQLPAALRGALQTVEGL